MFGRKKRLSFLDMLLEASEDGKIISDRELREEVNTFMFAVKFKNIILFGIKFLCNDMILGTRYNNS